MKAELPRAIYIEAMPLVPRQKSGVGYTLQQTLVELSRLAPQYGFKIFLIAPLGKARYLKDYVNDHVAIKTLYLPARVIEVLMRLRLLLPVDWFLGRGMYVFPNYKNWPLWRSRSVTYVYDIGYMKHPDTVQPKNQAYLRRYMPMWLRRTDKIVTISNQVREELERKLNVLYSVTGLVYCGVDRTAFKKQDPSTIQRVKNKYGIEFDKYLLFVGNIEPRKNLAKLLEAYSGLPKQMQQQYGLVLVGGDGWLNEAFYAQLNALKAQGTPIYKVEKHVAYADLPAIYSGASLLVHPAVYEGFGMTPLEAMACETPVVVSDIPSVREVVQDAGVYFDPADTGSIRDAIQVALAASQVQTKASVKIGLVRAEQLSWEASAKSLYEIVDEEYARGQHKYPVLKRLAAVYKFMDEAIRSALGDKVYEPYAPAPNKGNFKRQLYEDFLFEQPTHAQFHGLRTYLAAKHFVASGLKTVVRSARGR